jgi:catechol 2,3-dioxygenase-like lactoylglutathione lyase family enzyme
MIEDFQHVRITCRDIERSINFYQRLELRVGRGVQQACIAGVLLDCSGLCS